MIVHFPSIMTKLCFEITKQSHLLTDSATRIFSEACSLDGRKDALDDFGAANVVHVLARD